jgi:hypothetical protein
MAGTASNTKRPLNRCTSCGKTWYPRGGNRSSRCPKCGSSKTKIAGLGIIGTLGSLALMLVMGGHPDNHNLATTANSAESTVRVVDNPAYSSQPHDSSEVDIEQTSPPQTASDTASDENLGQSQAALTPAISVVQSGGTKVTEAKMRDAANTDLGSPASAPDAPAMPSTFMHH